MADPRLAVSAAEELLRYGPPVAIAARYVPDDREIVGYPIRTGAAVVASLLGANRDPEAFEDPHAFQVRRGRRDHTASGGGVHACLGAPLVRFEIEIALRLMAEHYPRMRLTAPVDV